MERVPVVSAEGKPLMPTKPSKARKLVKGGKAIGKWNKLNQYYIQLTFTPSGEGTQPISCGIDPGKHYGSVGIQSSFATLFTSHIFLPFETVKKRMEQRALMRRSRRGRRINRKVPYSQRAHRQCRFSNRKQGKLPPSIRANCQLLLRITTELSQVYPISSIVYEYCKADVDLTSGRKKAKSGKGLEYIGWCSGDTKSQISVSDRNWTRLGQFSKNKTQLLKRSTGLICKQLIGGRRFLPTLISPKYSAGLHAEEG